MQKVRFLVACTLLLNCFAIATTAFSQAQQSSTEQLVNDAARTQDSDDRRQSVRDADSASASEELIIAGLRARTGEWLLIGVTLLLSFATAALWWSTRKLVKGAERTAERQLRAYLFVKADDKLLPDFHQGNVIVYLMIRNSGQTPAYQVRNWISMAVLPHPLTAPPPTKPETLQYTSAAIAAQSEVTMRGALNRSLTPEEKAGMLGQRLRIYIFGEIEYLDAFEKPRTTRFRFMMPFNPDGTVPGIAFHIEGNEAT